MRASDQAQVQFLRYAAVVCPAVPARQYVRHYLDHQPMSLEHRWSAKNPDGGGRNISCLKTRTKSELSQRKILYTISIPYTRFCFHQIQANPASQGLTPFVIPKLLAASISLTRLASIIRLVSHTILSLRPSPVECLILG
jgi:hypothetical protein